MQTLYANVINLKLTPNEVVLEFGSAFPDRPVVGAPPGFQPDIRIVLAPGSLPGLAQLFSQAMAQQRTGGTPPPTGPVH